MKFNAVLPVLLLVATTLCLRFVGRRQMSLIKIVSLDKEFGDF